MSALQPATLDDLIRLADAAAALSPCDPENKRVSVALALASAAPTILRALTILNDPAALWANHLRGTITLPIDRMQEEVRRPLLASFDARQAELLTANNREVDRRRKAEHETERLLRLLVAFVKAPASEIQTSVGLLPIGSEGMRALDVALCRALEDLRTATAGQAPSGG